MQNTWNKRSGGGYFNPLLKDITGLKFGKLRVIKFSGHNKHGQALWEVICECGNTRLIDGSVLRRGDRKSCGCFRATSTSERMTTHGQSGTREYRAWAKLKSRCTNKNASGYDRYGGRGIRVCKRWRTSFQNFFDDMGKCPSGKSIERVKNHLGYYPGNCRWATPVEQSNNRRSNRYIVFRGQTKTLAEWCRFVSLNYKMVFHRLSIGWSISRALSTPRISGASPESP